MNKYKEIIQNMLKSDNNIQSSKKIIKKLLKNDFDNHKITESEYIELNRFLVEKLNEEDKNNNRQKFIQELKLVESMILRVEPIYKGEIGKVAPKMETRKKLNDNQEEER